MIQYLCAFFDYEGNRPGEEVHEVGQKIRMRTLYKLLDIKSVILHDLMITSNFITAPLLL